MSLYSSARAPPALALSPPTYSEAHESRKRNAIAEMNWKENEDTHDDFSKGTLIGAEEEDEEEILKQRERRRQEKIEKHQRRLEERQKKLEAGEDLDDIVSIATDSEEEAEYVKKELESQVKKGRKAALLRARNMRPLERRGKKEYPLSLLKGWMKLGKIGTGVALYFQFLKFMIIFFSFASLVNIPLFVVNWMFGEGVADNVEEPPYIVYLFRTNSFINYNYLPLPHMVMFVFNLGVLISLLLVWRYDRIRQVRKIDRELLTAPDYTSQCRRIHQSDVFYLSGLREYMEQYGEVSRLIVMVRCSSLGPKIKALDVLRKEMFKLMSQLQIAKTERHHSDVQVLGAELKVVRSKYGNLKKQLDKIQSKPPRVTGDMFVTFRYEAANNAFLRDHQVSRCHRFVSNLTCNKMWPTPRFRRRLFAASRPSEPSDINLKNLELTSSKRYLRLSIGIVAVVIILCINIGIIVYVEFSTFATLFIVRLALAVVISVSNLLLRQLLKLISGMVGSPTQSHQEALLVQWLTISQYLNSVAIPFATQYNPNTWANKDGLFPTMGLVILINAFVPDITHTIQFGYRLRKWGFSWCAKSQDMLNKLVEPPDLLLAERYAAVIKTYVYGVTFGPLMPVIYIITLAGLLVTRLVDYYMLIKVYKKPPNTSEELSDGVRTFVLLGLWTSVAAAITGFGFETIAFTVENPDRMGFTLESMMVFALWFLFMLSIFMTVVYIAFPVEVLAKGKDHNEYEVKDDDTPYEAVHGIEKYEYPIDDKFVSDWFEKSTNSKCQVIVVANDQQKRDAGGAEKEEEWTIERLEEIEMEEKIKEKMAEHDATRESNPFRDESSSGDDSDGYDDQPEVVEEHEEQEEEDESEYESDEEGSNSGSDEDGSEEDSEMSDVSDEEVTDPNNPNAKGSLAVRTAGGLLNARSKAARAIVARARKKKKSLGGR